jgi:hypothetical protein
MPKSETIFLFSPDSSGILCFFPLKKQRYSGWRDDDSKEAF